MTDDRISPSAAHDLLVRADPVPHPLVPDSDDIAWVVRQARAADDATVSTALRSRPGAARRRRVVVVAGVGVAAAAAVAAVVVIAAGDGPSTPSRAPVADRVLPTHSVATSVVPHVSTTPTTAVTAPPVTDPVLFLHTAATATASQPFTPPRPDQFLYVHEDGGYQAWMSMDGTHDGLILPSDNPDDRIPTPGCRDGVTTEVAGGRTVTTPCTPDPAYRPDIPSDPAALEQWLAAQAGGPSTNSVAKQVLETLEFDYLTPATRGALYTVLSGYEGLTVVDVPAEPDAVGVTWSYGGGSVTLVFGRADHAYRGVLTQDGTYVDGSTSIVVDAVGQTG